MKEPYSAVLDVSWSQERRCQRFDGPDWWWCPFKASSESTRPPPPFFTSFSLGYEQQGAGNGPRLRAGRREAYVIRNKHSGEARVTCVCVCVRRVHNTPPCSTHDPLSGWPSHSAQRLTETRWRTLRVLVHRATFPFRRALNGSCRGSNRPLSCCTFSRFLCFTSPSIHSLLP